MKISIIARTITSTMLREEPCELVWLAPVNCDSILNTIITNKLKNFHAELSFSVADSFKPHLISSPSFLGYGGVLPPGVKDLDITLHSVNQDILIDSISLDESHFSIINGNVSNFLLLRNESIKITIRFTPTDSSITFSFLNIYTGSSCFGNIIPITAGFPNTPPNDPAHKTIKLKSPVCGDILILATSWSIILFFRSILFLLGIRFRSVSIILLATS